MRNSLDSVVRGSHSHKWKIFSGVPFQEVESKHAQNASKLDGPTHMLVFSTPRTAVTGRVPSQDRICLRGFTQQNSVLSGKDFQHDVSLVVLPHNTSDQHSLPSTEQLNLNLVIYNTLTQGHTLSLTGHK